MLTTLRLQDFQGYCDTTIAFHPQFNCIIGTGNSGKSSIARALDFLIYNEWDKSWVNYTANYCTVTATLANGIVLIRQKGEGVNKYTIQYPNGKSQKYESIDKTGIPEEISKAWQISPLAVDDKREIKLNLVSQGTGSILKTITSTGRAKLLGQLSGLDVLDSVGSNLALDRKRLITSSKLKEEELLKTENQLRQLTTVLSYRASLDQVKDNLTVVHEQCTKLQELRSLSTRMASWKQRHQLVKNELDHYKQLPTFQIPSMEYQLDRLARLRQLQSRITQYKSRHQNLVSRLNTVTQELQHTKVTYVAQLTSSQLCPTCYGPITQECVDKVLSTL